MNVHEKLAHVQKNMKCNKGQFNKFGGYAYRSCEDIFEAVKPHLNDVKTTLTMCDEIVLIGERFYIKSTATFTDCETSESIQVSAYAREEENKKGMSAEQQTGSCSSYARKYCLNGFFLLDDTKDADTEEYTKQTGKAPEKAKISPTEPTKEQKAKLMAMCKVKGQDIKEILKAVGCTDKMTMAQYNNAISLLENGKEDK